VQAGAARFKLHVYGYIVMPEHVHLLLSEPQRDASSDGTCASTNSEALAVVFTIGQINDLRARLGSTKTLVEYLRGLRTLGVERYDFYLADGHSEYFGQGGHRVVYPPVHEVLPVAETGQRETFLEHLRRHEGTRRLT
jgi:Protein of unknown function (DUF1398)